MEQVTFDQIKHLIIFYFEEFSFDVRHVSGKLQLSNLIFN